jgi:glycerate dehydrogenase
VPSHGPDLMAAGEGMSKESRHGFVAGGDQEPVRIVILDGFTLSPLRPGESSPDHPSWDPLAELGELQVFDRSAASEVVERAAGAQVVLSNKVALSEATLDGLPGLRYVGVTATGTNIIDGSAARARGITVTNVPGYSAMSVVQMVFGLLFELAGRVGETAAAVRDGAWTRSPDFCFTLGPSMELAGRTLGIVGAGAIGLGVAKVAHALNMRVLIHSRTPKTIEHPAEWVGLDQLLREADVISLHCPLTPETECMINARTLGTMKPGVLLINTGRGPLLDEPAVAEALKSGHLGGLGADVLTHEPPPADNPLLSAPRTIITPHIAWATTAARQRLMHAVINNLRNFLNGTPVNVVNP